ncbi:NPC intracellular cholesterol transporter 1 isoform X2 [Folsomia candida]|uniref:NPC intracellular cholesterol transporter 1 isoform X2 n=1 Tax=Folsomia candida TaxID=158441 RepID=UPI001604DCDA|nr:NPC intracellular cholesterol transporter 1 isoform X2 [Folsomia candida]
MVENSGNILEKLSVRSKTSLENFFYRWGFTVATHPGKFVSICVLATVLFGSGIILIKEESRPDKLILPATAEYAVNTEWIRSKVAIPLRENYAGIVADNVLTPEVMKVLIDLHEKVKAVSTRDGKTWSDVCFRVPVTKIDLGEESLRRKRREANNSDASATISSSGSHNDWDSAFDDDFFKESTEEDVKPKQWTVYHSIPESLYCSIIDTLEEACLESNPVELWSYDKDVIYNLTQEEIIRVFNHEIISPVFGRKTKYKMELGGKIEKNEKGEIIKAESLLMTWDVKVDITQEMITDTQGLVGDAAGLEWEKEWIKSMKKFAKEMPSGIKLHFLNAACWGDILDETLIQEGIVLVCGFGIMFLYVAMMLGKPNMIEQRPFLTLAGLGSIAFSLIIGCGFCAFLSFPFMTLNRVMPFLILGIGIDDMFVIMQCFNNLDQHDSLKKTKMGTIPERIALTLKNAGVSITLTSLTDIAAFGVGCLSTIPSLRSFCLYAVVGISVLFIFQCTLFVACLAIDQKRLEERRNAFLFCIQYEEDKIPRSSTKNYDKGLIQMFFDKILSKYLLTKTSKVIVIISTVFLLASGIYGNVHLRQHSDALWFIPEDSYMVQFIRMFNTNYPKIGYPGLLVAHEMNWTESLPIFGELLEDLQESPHLHEIMQFYTSLKDFVMDVYEIDLSEQQLNEQQFSTYMGKFLWSPYGARYKYFFKLNDTFSCGESLPDIKTAIVPFHFKRFIDGSQEHLTAMNAIKSLVRNTSRDVTFNKNSGDEGRVFFWAQISIAWEVDEV